MEHPLVFQRLQFLICLFSQFNKDIWPLLLRAGFLITFLEPVLLALLTSLRYVTRRHNQLALPAATLVTVGQLQIPYTTQAS